MQCNIYKTNLHFREIICWIFYMIHHGSITFCVAHNEVTVWRENKYRSQPRDLSLAWISFSFCSTFQFYPFLYPNSYPRGFLSNTVQLWPTWIFQIIQFFVPKLGSTTRPPSVSFFWQCNPIAPSSHWRHEYLTLKKRHFIYGQVNVNVNELFHHLAQILFL